jgi:hypothetical protein
MTAIAGKNNEKGILVLEGCIVNTLLDDFEKGKKFTRELFDEEKYGKYRDKIVFFRDVYFANYLNNSSTSKDRYLLEEALLSNREKKWHQSIRVFGKFWLQSIEKILAVYNDDKYIVNVLFNKITSEANISFIKSIDKLATISGSGIHPFHSLISSQSKVHAVLKNCDCCKPIYDELKNTNIEVYLKE